MQFPFPLALIHENLMAKTMSLIRKSLLSKCVDRRNREIAKVITHEVVKCHLRVFLVAPLC